MDRYVGAGQGRIVKPAWFVADLVDVGAAVGPGQSALELLCNVRGARTAPYRNRLLGLGRRSDDSGNPLSIYTCILLLTLDRTTM